MTRGIFLQSAQQRPVQWCNILRKGGRHVEIWRRTFQRAGTGRARVLQWSLLSEFIEWQEEEPVTGIRSCGEGLGSRTRSYWACSSQGSIAELRAEDQHDLNCLKSAGLKTDCGRGSKGDKGPCGKLLLSSRQKWWWLGSGYWVEIGLRSDCIMGNFWRTSQQHCCYTERGEVKGVLRVWAAGRMQVLLRREREMEEMISHEKSVMR